MADIFPKSRLSRRLAKKFADVDWAIANTEYLSTVVYFYLVLHYYYTFSMIYPHLVSIK